MKSYKYNGTPVYIIPSENLGNRESLMDASQCGQCLIRVEDYIEGEDINETYSDSYGSDSEGEEIDEDLMINCENTQHRIYVVDTVYNFKEDEKIVARTFTDKYYNYESELSRYIESWTREELLEYLEQNGESEYGGLSDEKIIERWEDIQEAKSMRDDYE